MTRVSSLATIYGDLLILPGISTSDRIIRLLVEEGKFSNSIFQKPADSRELFHNIKGWESDGRNSSTDLD